jgi:hypothetical protein
MMHFFLALTATLLACPIKAFVVTNTNPNRLSSVIVAAEEPGTGNAEDFFAAEGWQPIKKDLNELPIFTVATKEGNPLAYEIENNGKTVSVPCFFCDIEDAKKELENTKQNSDMEGVDLVPFPLGEAFQLWVKDEAVIVPSKDAILQAGAPPGTNPIGQQVPLFGCLDIMEEGENGKGVLPLFMVKEDANAALTDAVEADGGSIDDFEVVSFSLNRAVELLATVPDTTAFKFVPPSASMKYIQDYLS